LSLNARVVIMDEPTSSLTLAETTTLHALVADLRARGVGVVYISHRLGEVQAVADRAVVLRDGANVGELARDALTHDNMVRLMVGRIAVVSAAGMIATLFQGRRAAHQRYPGQTVSFTARPRGSSAWPAWSALAHRGRTGAFRAPLAGESSIDASRSR
jgi:ribose transport system ATP-binding protein